MKTDLKNRHMTPEIFNLTNSTFIDKVISHNEPLWMVLLWCGLFGYLVSCLFTFHIRMCDSKDYYDNIGFCCCLIYRDLISLYIIVFIQIFILIYECLFCKCCLNAKTKGHIIKKYTRIKTKINEQYNTAKFKIKNSITPLEATMVEDTNINTSIVIEGLNNNNQIISIIVVPIDELVAE